jgi:Icc-related predicted phosphoesterase
MAGPLEKVRIAAAGDLHCTHVLSRENLQPFFTQVAERADVLLLCGDLTNYGLPEEAQTLVKELSTVKVPVIGVLGNHDYESGKQDDIRRILTDAGMTILDGDAREIHGIGFAGAKGFGGGFGDHALQPWGEPIIKTFVHEAVEETLKLESALARLRTFHRVVLLHYAPIRATVEGEPVDIFPYLGSSRLEEPLDRYRVTAVFHGHAHHGAFQGRTRGGVPVYNVAMPLLRRLRPDQPPFHIIELPVASPATAVTVPVS